MIVDKLNEAQKKWKKKVIELNDTSHVHLSLRR